MINPRTIHQIVFAAVSLMGSLAAILALAGPSAEFWQSLVFAKISVNGLLLALSLTLSFLAPFYILNRRLFEERAKHHNTVQMLDAASIALKDAERLRHTDVITGIPNQRKWDLDVERISKLASDGRPFQQIMIDLDGFREINKKHGYAAGDKVLAFFAQSIHEGMRRNEEMYKRPFDEAIQDHELWKRVYRKYTGGDEFLFLIEGTEAEAIGFLVRLQKRIDNELNKHISNEILGVPYELSFHGAVCPLYRDDDLASAFSRVQDGLRVANQTGRRSRVFWFSKTQAADLDPKSWIGRAYADAEQVFAVSDDVLSKQSA